MTICATKTHFIQLKGGEFKDEKCLNCKKIVVIDEFDS